LPSQNQPHVTVLEKGVLSCLRHLLMLPGKPVKPKRPQLLRRWYPMQ